MILFPAMLIGGHLMIAVVDKAPDLDFDPVCRSAASESLGSKNEYQICIKSESVARDELAKKWSEFESADRVRCIRLSTMSRIASYIEVLTCLEMERDVKKMRARASAAIDVPVAPPGPA